MPSVDFSLSFGPIEDKRFALRPRSKDQKELPFSIVFVCEEGAFVLARFVTSLTTCVSIPFEGSWWRGEEDGTGREFSKGRSRK